MRDVVAAYEQRAISIAFLIAQLEGLLSSLREPDPQWRALAEKEWAIIEDCYAFALDAGQTELDSESKALVARALASLKRLLDTKTDVRPG
jgi:hypothetical protein